MLVLSRKEGESIVIDGEIRVTVLKSNGKVTRLGIEAPSDVPIRRSELDFHLTDPPSKKRGDAHPPEKSNEFPDLGALI